jgi:signal transduction histidine kinase/integral membrane sensor domain MASE1
MSRPRVATPSFSGLKGPLLLSIAYYLACWVGFSIRLAPATTSVLWPPNSVLTAALLLVPPAHWWLYLAIVFPAHVLAELQMGLPVPLVLALFVTNCGEALIAAGIIRWLNDSPARFDTLRQAVVLVVGAVVVAPLVTTFPDAAAVSVLRDEPYWVVWGRRLPSNALAGLTAVPAVLSLVTGASLWVRTASFRRKSEAALLALALVPLGLWVFSDPEPAFALPGAPYTSLSFLVPMLLWSAVRFGPGGASLSLLATVVLATWAATHGLHPLGALSPSEGTFAMQVFLLVVGVPLVFLAALVEERRKAEGALRGSLQFERTLSEVSGTFARLCGDDIDTAFSTALARLGSLLPVDLLLLFPFEGEGNLVRTGWFWARPGIERPKVERYRDEAGSSFAQHLARGESDAREGTGEMILIPLSASGRLLGGLAALPSQDGGPRLAELRQRLPLVEAVLLSALARQSSEAEARRSRDALAHSLRVSTMGVLASSLAHEIKQPLFAILTNAETALSQIDEGSTDPRELRLILSEVVEADRRASEVIDRIRRMVRKGESERATFDLNAVVLEALSVLRRDAASREVSIDPCLHVGSLVVRGDRVQIQQVILNLLLNAIEATASGALAERRVTVRTSLVDGTITTVVEDGGLGLPAGMEDRIFEPFYSTRPAGMGMGLSIAFDIVRAHGGTLRAWNGPTRGAVFRFDLPSAGKSAQRT